MDQSQETYRAHLARQGFALEEWLGRGLSGNVWLARQPNLNHRPVAVKFCDTPAAQRDPDVRSRFMREAELLTRCQHPRIPYILTRGLVNGLAVPYIVMEFIDGNNLASTLESEGTMSPQRALQVMLPVLDALALVHRYHVVHRDVTSHNIMLTADGPMLIDFSIGTDGRRTADGPTRANQQLGNVDYAAPEQLTDARNVDARADVYSAALVLYELMTGQIRFKRTSARRLLEGVPDKLLDTLATATSDDPADRFPDADALRHALRPFLRGSRLAWQEQVPLAICQNVECWEWDGWDGGIWSPHYHEDTRARCCTECGEPLLRHCPGCYGSLAKTKHCADCGVRFIRPPTCSNCHIELDWREWDESKDEDKLICHSCRPRRPEVDFDTSFDTDDIPF